MRARYLLSFVCGLVLVPAVLALVVPDHPTAAPQAPAVGPAQQAAPAGPKLGAQLPKNAFDAGRYRIAQYANGKTFVAARLGANRHAFAATAQPPAVVNYWQKAEPALRRMYLNNVLGNCVIASSFHGDGVLTGNDAGAAFQYADADAQRYYELICGHLGHDAGCLLPEVMNYHRDYGFISTQTPGPAHRISDYAAVDWSNQNEVMTALSLFGYLKVAMSMPSAWYNNAHPGAVWDVLPNNFQVVGAHDVGCVGYNSQGVQITTWGMYPPITITWAAFTSKGLNAFGNAKYLAECYAILSTDWTGNDNLAPNGVSAATLKADMALLKQGITPPPPGPVTPPQPPPGTLPGEVYADGHSVWWWNSVGQQKIVVPYPGFGGEIRVASDGRFVATAPGPGGGPHLLTYDFETSKQLISVNVPGIDVNFRGGCHVSMQKGWGQVGVTPGDGGGPILVELDPTTGRVIGSQNRGLNPNSRNGLVRFLIAR